MDRELALEFVRVTEAAAIMAARWTGRGDKEAADLAAVEAIRDGFASVNVDGLVVIGEGKKDKAPMLYIGERVGCASHPKVDIAVDPVEGTNIVASGQPNAISVIAIGDRGCLFRAPESLVYMNKMAVGPEAAGRINIDAPVIENLRAVARAKEKRIGDLMVVVLDRERNSEVIREVRRAGARIRLIPGGDVNAVVATALPESGVDMYLGVGGSPEGVIGAAALRCLGGEIQCRFWPRSDEDFEDAVKEGFSEDRIKKVYSTEDLTSGEDVFFAATGITDGDYLHGVRFERNVVRTQSIVMRAKTGTIRFIDAVHRLDKKMILNTATIEV